MNVYKYRIKEGAFIDAKQTNEEINFHLTDASRLRFIASNLLRLGEEDFGAYAYPNVSARIASYAGIRLAQLDQIRIETGHSN